jgi:hypothetical protein
MGKSSREHPAWGGAVGEQNERELQMQSNNQSKHSGKALVEFVAACSGTQINSRTPPVTDGLNGMALVQ